MIKKSGSFGKRSSTQNQAQPKLRRPTDKRKSDRSETFKSAKIYTGGDVVHECAVRNLNNEGCMISLFGAENLPDQIEIHLGLGQKRRKARVAWRDKNDAGLEFLPGE